MIKVTVKASTSYDVRIGSGLIRQAGETIKDLHIKAKTVAIVTDETVRDLYLETVTKSLKQAELEPQAYVIPPGEASKSGTTYLALLEWLVEKQITRSDCLLALGGGVAGDLTGFVAATYLRGTPYIQVPTTLLAMADSSVGGKTAINLEAGKNLAGAFYQPSCVLCDTAVLDTLPKEIFHEGIAEIVKYGMLGNARLLDQLLNEPLTGNLDHIIAACVTMKRDIVERDEFDKGERQLLNFGHTVGHAIERQSGFQISHGHAVAIGMRIETAAAVKQDACPQECLYMLENLLRHFDLPIQTDYSPGELFEAALHDKKRTGDEVTVVVPYALGKCRLKQIPVKELRNWIEMGLELCV